MKNKYFGDVGDFGKYILLLMLLKTGLRVGLNWYLTEDDLSTDGKYIDYFINPDFMDCDEELYNFLKECIDNNRRNVKELKKFNRFDPILVYEEVLDVKEIKALSEQGRTKRKELRESWFNKSIKALDNSNVIFCDPDNGIETLSLSKTSNESVKYVYINEIEKMLDAGHSVVVYNHRDRSKEDDYKAKIKRIYSILNRQISLRIIRFNRYSVRDYIFFIQKEHEPLINRQIELLLNESSARKLFKEFEL